MSLLPPYKEVVYQTTVADTYVSNKGMGQKHWFFCNLSTKITNKYKWFTCYDTHLHTPGCHRWPCSHLHSSPHTLPAACRSDCCTADTGPGDYTPGTWRDTLRTQQDTLWTQYDTWRDNLRTQQDTPWTQYDTWRDTLRTQQDTLWTQYDTWRDTLRTQQDTLWTQHDTWRDMLWKHTIYSFLQWLNNKHFVVLFNNSIWALLYYLYSLMQALPLT